MNAQDATDPLLRKVLLVILDGWGLSPDPSVSAIAAAKTPVFDALWEGRTYAPRAQLNTTGLAVGLPEGQMGNSEVGHMNLGAGRVVYQELARINEAFRTRSIHDNPTLKTLIEYVQAHPGARLHVMGLASRGGVHAHLDHMMGLLEYLDEVGLGQLTAVHAFTDGRDNDPHAAAEELPELAEACRKHGAKLASVTGRYYAMDRDRRWERTARAYRALVEGAGYRTTDPIAALERSYEKGITDEFIEPIIVTDPDGVPLGQIRPYDAVLCCNFRTDRGRQITQALTQEAYPEEGMSPLPLHYVTMTGYDERYHDVGVLFEKDNLDDTLGEVIARHGHKQIRIAETEKYPHVTFFFNGGREVPFEGEERLLCPSPKVATYDLAPAMSAHGIVDQIVPRLRQGDAAFVCLNFANADMVGHTGIFEAAVRAVETVDECLGQVLEAAREGGYTTWVIADHGNSDVMRNADGSPNTQHSTNPVPSILVGEGLSTEQGVRLFDGVLGDIAPTILSLMGLPIPTAMTGQILVTGAHPMGPRT